MDERELISKKDLLEATGISYGQLYRWKRKQLIPEDWFIRKSTFTGQETFFPKTLILQRIDRILNMKDDLSLDELAGKLSPLLYDVELRKDELIKRNIVSKVVLDRYAAKDAPDAIYPFEKTLFFFIVDKMLQGGGMSLEEGVKLLETLREHFAKCENGNGELLLIRKMGVSSFILTTGAGGIFFENGVKVVERLSLSDCVEELKMKIG
ncbi:YhbD family protein [Paenibacillus humicola]|uniref:YhbD family protein n=1 Tax=Paenibacillus humicola TaxID=3110540 RepID=UPI00237B7D26|nr:YhbD family protein [Paenibacillus humicola]